MTAAPEVALMDSRLRGNDERKILSYVQAALAGGGKPVYASISNSV
jgi:hypothetical protein